MRGVGDEVFSRCRATLCLVAVNLFARYLAWKGLPKPNKGTPAGPRQSYPQFQPARKSALWNSQIGKTRTSAACLPRIRQDSRAIRNALRGKQKARPTATASGNSIPRLPATAARRIFLEWSVRRMFRGRAATLPALPRTRTPAREEKESRVLPPPNSETGADRSVVATE